MTTLGTSKAGRLAGWAPAASPPTLPVEPPPRERIDRGEGTGLGRPWHVIVLNDDHNTFPGVAFALASVIPGVTYDRGMALANRIHNTGRAIVWSGLRERAELYWEQLQGHGLTMAPLEQG